MSFLRTLSRLRQVARDHPPGGILIPGEAMEDFRDLRIRRMADAARRGEPWPIRGGDYSTYYITNTPLAVTTTLKSLVQLATSSADIATVVAFDLTQDGALNATTAATRVDWYSTTTANSVGSAATVQKLFASSATNSTTGRINDTTIGATATLLGPSFYVPVTSGLSYQFPQGRELTIPVSAFRHFAITGQTGVSANALVNLYWTE